VALAQDINWEELLRDEANRKRAAEILGISMAAPPAPNENSAPPEAGATTEGAPAFADTWAAKEGLREPPQRGVYVGSQERDSNMAIYDGPDKAWARAFARQHDETAPTWEDYYDRLWSEDFARINSRPPTLNDWRMHYYVKYKGNDIETAESRVRYETADPGFRRVQADYSYEDKYGPHSVSMPSTTKPSVQPTAGSGAGGGGGYASSPAKTTSSPVSRTDFATPTSGVEQGLDPGTSPVPTMQTRLAAAGIGPTDPLDMQYRMGLEGLPQNQPAPASADSGKGAFSAYLDDVGYRSQYDNPGGDKLLTRTVETSAGPRSRVFFGPPATPDTTIGVAYPAAGGQGGGADGELSPDEATELARREVIARFLPFQLFPAYALDTAWQAGSGLMRKAGQAFNPVR
jgi:hypothetical protein